MGWHFIQLITIWPITIFDKNAQIFHPYYFSVSDNPLPCCERARRPLRLLVRPIDKAKRKIVYSDFEGRAWFRN
jgi:hypothetical protein